MTSHALTPITGEAVSLDAPTEDLAAFFDRLGGFRRELREAEDLLKRELALRLDHRNKRRDMFDGWQIEVDAPGQTEWNVGQLERVLTVLVEEGKLTEAAARAALEPTRVLKARKRELGKLLGLPHLNATDREALAGCEQPSGRPRRVTVKKA